MILLNLKKKKMEKRCSEFQRKRIESYFKYQKMKPRIRFQISKGREIASNPNRKEWKIIPNLKCENWKTRERFRLCRSNGRSRWAAICLGGWDSKSKRNSSFQSVRDGWPRKVFEALWPNFIDPIEDLSWPRFENPRKENARRKWLS